MARIRSIKPEMRRSLVVSSWPYPVRWTFVGLPGYLDDEGRGIDDVRLIKAELYPLDDDMTGRKIDQHLIAISTNGPLCRYQVDGQPYLHITSWAEHQRVNRPTPSRIPPCPVHEKGVKPHASLTEDSLPRAQARVPAEQGREQGAGNARAAQPRRSAPNHPLLETHETELGPLPRTTREHLAQHVQAAQDDGATDAQILAALEEWRRRPKAGPGLFPHLVDDQRLASHADQATEDQLLAIAAAAGARR